jgi:hypothetical protein
MQSSKPDKNAADYCGELRSVLDSSHQPETLDDHPWTQSLVVRAALAEHEFLSAKPPGYRLVFALSLLFREMMPSVPPRRGKRLDTHWGRFGILAAQYFAPFLYGAARPTSLRDAWGRIDQSIALFIRDGKPADQTPPEEIARYQIVGTDLDLVPNSTVSDWARGGLQLLADSFIQHETHLSAQQNKPSPLLNSSGSSRSMPVNEKPRPRALKRTYGWALGAALLILALSAGYKAWRVYELVQLVKGDMSALEGVTADALVDQNKVDRAGQGLADLERDIQALQSETDSIVGAGKYLGWLPVYGGDAASAESLLNMAADLSQAANDAYHGAGPILKAVNDPGQKLSPADLANQLLEARPDFTKARTALDSAAAARSQIDASSLSPKLQSLLIDEIDPAMLMLDEGLRLAIAFPKLLGASKEGPQTYLILIQNEDELRPTGGFITAVGTLVVQDGKPIALNIEDSGAQEDLSKLYSSAPWQLQEYMNSSVILLRDSNWFTDFPTAAMWAEYLYAYNHALSVDGVIAFDQQMIALLLEAIGPLDVAGVPYPITAENVGVYLRETKIKSESAGPQPNRKAFLYDLTEPLMNKLLSGDYSREILLQTLRQGLDERHMLLQFDDPDLTDLLARHNWDGAIRAGDGDFLMVVDTNIGFNKTNAVVDEQLSYQVDLTDPDAPQSLLTVTHNNHASIDVPCIQWNDTGSVFSALDDQSYPINRCYWNYIRVYTPTGTQLLEATPQAIPGEWMILSKDVPARVDVLDEEIEGVQAFGTLMVVPVNSALETSFTFLLPARVIERLPDSTYVYRIKIHKQPGTRAFPFHLQIKLPAGASVVTVSLPIDAKQNGLEFDLSLNQDLSIEIRYQIPETLP